MSSRLAKGSKSLPMHMEGYRAFAIDYRVEGVLVDYYARRATPTEPRHTDPYSNEAAAASSPGSGSEAASKAGASRSRGGYFAARRDVSRPVIGW